MTEAAMGRPTRSAIKQWWVLTTRVIAPTFRTGEFFVAIAMSVAFTVSLYVPLKQIMGHVVHGSYAQWIMPSICMQAIYFAAMSGALRSATDSVDGINRRLASMPMPRSAPMAARMSANFYRAGVALATALVCGHVIGFRFYRGPLSIVVFCAVVLLIGMVLALAGDLVGKVSTNPEATTHILLLPQLMFAMLSVGLQPVDQFPAWLQPVVRNQPHSQFVSILRAIAGNAEGTTATPSLSVIGPGLLWLLGVVVVTAWLYARVLRRRP
ncbi:MAG TPA: ABC transporter permease [Gordonia sp. (in: high G+C Gram-positive bacteria)]|uniref:ABC transporter permease n=1 Tax=unclassified Gordonia (in: high G+C Gram-positive bacteria) TaxID=2657482 RepID=UPI0025C22986|nr:MULTISPECIES: ABC transporter permease [unclassified Gordonia (in: high G+C Gram-positive bacteria)]HNP57315.1 ABC transporter permease [Gordonia sp. (in: high G+C Gram-positive bacteria)]HRC52487.1 ABC transporter permease [Gordonia sp. (in: high G+C Gram-positive bacteria)]